MSNPGRDPKEKKCGQCGKDIYAGEEWAYKRRIGGTRTKWFCSYKCMRAWDAKHETEKKPVIPAEDQEDRAPKQQGSRAVLAQKLAKEIKAGHSVTAFLKAEGYKNPYEAYHAVRHYCETKMPEMLLILKPMKQLPKQTQAPRTGRPRKYKAEVELATEVPKVDKAEDPEPVHCIAHVNPADLAEAEEAEVKKPGFRYEIKTIETEIGDFSYDRNAHLLIFRRKDEEKEFGYQYLSMSTAEWEKLLIIVPKLADLMGVTL